MAGRETTPRSRISPSRSRQLASLFLVAAAAGAATLAVSGDQKSGPETPPGIEGRADPFLGVAVVGGGGGLVEAVDAYGNVVDLRYPGPAGESQISLPHRRQEAGTVSPRTGLTLAFADGGREPEPAWEADLAAQSYLRRTNVLRTSISDESALLQFTDAARGPALGRHILLAGNGELRLRLLADFDLAGNPGGDSFSRVPGGFAARGGERSVRCTAAPRPHVEIGAGGDPWATLTWRGESRLGVELTCSFSRFRSAGAPASSVLRAAGRADRRWLLSGHGLGPGAPIWARRLHDRSLLVLRALTDPRTGAMAAGLREAWAYVWPRDAATAALALAETGHGTEARAIAGFLSSLDLGAGARFDGDGVVIGDGRPAQGDAGGWTRLAREAAGLPADDVRGPGWRGRPDYGERSGDDGDYVANAIAAGVGAERLRELFAGQNGFLVRRAGVPSSELDSAIAWAAAPFPRPGLEAEVAETLRAVSQTAGPYGLEPHTHWPGSNPWTAPAAWLAFGEAALGRRHAALTHVARLQRAATEASLLPERVDAGTGLPVSTTPLGWSHAFAILALRELWPPVRSP